MTPFYQETHFWSPQLAADAVRVAMIDPVAGEYFLVIANSAGGTDATYQARLAAAQTAVEVALCTGAEPGQIVSFP